MAVVQRPGWDVVRGMEGHPGRGLRVSWIAAVVLIAIMSVMRSANGAEEWVAPASFDDVPVRPIDLQAEAVAPKSIVVPLPTGLATGGSFLAAMGAARWWTSARRRRAWAGAGILARRP